MEINIYQSEYTTRYITRSSLFGVNVSCSQLSLTAMRGEQFAKEHITLENMRKHVSHVFSHGLSGLWNLKTLDNSLTGSMWCKLNWWIYITASAYGLSHQGQ